MTKNALILGFAVVSLAGCGGGMIRTDSPPPRPAPTPHGSQVRIPPGHMPPPGKCRYWYPDRPPGHQPAIGDCAQLARRVPHGAILVDGGPAAVQTPGASVKPASLQVKVPPGHMPPKGKCRIWFPDRPPGRQPSVGECGDLERRVPQGAALVRG